MIWGEKDVDPLRLENLEVLDQAPYLLGFNEPNFGAQVRYNSMRKSKYLISTMYASLARTCSACFSLSETHTPSDQHRVNTAHALSRTKAKAL